MIKKNKNTIILFLLFFIVYFILGIFLTYYLDISKFWNVLFDLDSPRVLGDLSLREFNHYRSAVHPLFVILFQPIVFILKNIINNSIISIILIQSILASLSLVIFYLILKKIDIKKNKYIVYLCLFGLCFGQIIFSISIETYIYAQFFLMLLWYFALCKMDKAFSIYDYCILILLGIGSIAITITNFIQFLIVLLFVLILNKKVKKKILSCAIVIVSVICITVTLAELQNVIWPTAPNFFSKGLNDLIFHNSEEKLYISYLINLDSFKNVINSNFSQLFNITNFYIPSEGGYLNFNNTKITTLISILFFCGFVFLNLNFIIKEKRNIKKHKFYCALLLAYIANFVLHLFYGNSLSYIYVCHYNFIIILLIAYIFKHKNFKIFNQKIVCYLITAVIIVLSFKNIYLLFYYIFPLYKHIDSINLFPFAVIFISLLLLIFLLIKKKLLIVLLVIGLSLFVYITWHFVNTKQLEENFAHFEYYVKKYKKYNYQLNLMKNDFNISEYDIGKEPINIFLFGLANRPKIVFKDGKLIDIKSQKILLNINYTDYLIIPNEYTVILKDKNDKYYKIFENETGIYFNKNGITEVIYEDKNHINLPNFENLKYSEILKVLHQEILFNIDGATPKPNLFGYGDAWYRDTLLATFVLEKTDNINLLKDWVESIDNIYDLQRGKDIYEIDNLGELLYIIGASGVKRDDLISEIVKEVNRLKQADGTINGVIDGFKQSYYPTALAMFGAKKNNIDLGLKMPTVDEGYGRLTWYFDKPELSNQSYDSKHFPYLGWAFYHYNKSGKLYILDELYPLSYEGSDSEDTGRIESECFISEYYCKQKVILTHLWHASEMFLYLENY